ncbi:hypothetical protein DMUE_0235 [Dictyocoela muelleri]|nr:hypothetical protein DMUE_0235 [Dictyocoela muelleri]
MTKHPIVDINIILNQISATENIIIESLSLTCNLEKENFHNREYSTKNTKEIYKRNRHRENKESRKFCSYHKTSTHNDEECRALNKENKHHNSKDKTLVVKESTPKIKNIEVDINIKDH